MAVKSSDEAGDNVVVVDALPKEQWQNYGRRIRRLGAKVNKVRGVRRDENDPLIRLADALCGFVRDAYEKKPEMKALLEVALQKKIIRDLRL